MRLKLMLLSAGLASLAFVGAWAGCGGEEPPLNLDPPAPESNDDGDEEGPEGDGLADEGDEDAGDGTPPPKAAEGATTPIPSKIRYVLVLIKENRTFDNYFTNFPGAESSDTAKLSNGKTIKRAVAPNGNLPRDICHTNACGQRAYSKGSMDGFDLGKAGRLPFIHYTENQIPNYWQYGRNFVLADHFFSTTLGPSSPGHQVFWAGRSLSIDNAKCTKPGGDGCVGHGCAGDKLLITAYDPDDCSTKKVEPCFKVPSLTDHLPAKFSWMDYGGPVATMIKSVTDDPNYKSHFRTANNLVGDLAAGRLANLTIAHINAGDKSEHPELGPCVGENFSVDVINAAMKLPQWKEMAIILTWDDWGGFYDHVKPPVHKCKNGEIFQSGFRLPLLLMSPYARKGFVLKTPTEQASVPKLVEELWGMTFMSTRDKRARDGQAGSLMGAFDFAQAPREPLLLKTHACP
jgi:phospholipase C